MKLKSTIVKLEHVIRCGDWHDRPIRYSVQTQGESQNFSTKREAQRYAAIRNRADSQKAAISTWVNEV